MEKVTSVGAEQVSDEVQQPHQTQTLFPASQEERSFLCGQRASMKPLCLVTLRGREQKSAPKTKTQTRTPALSLGPSLVQVPARTSDSNEKQKAWRLKRKKTRLTLFRTCSSPYKILKNPLKKKKKLIRLAKPQDTRLALAASNPREKKRKRYYLSSFKTERCSRTHLTNDVRPVPQKHG